jgi:uncharacterized protein YwqG
VNQPDLRTLLKQNRLDEWADRILATEQRSLFLRPQGRGRRVAHLGGQPRLPAGEPWPAADDEPLSFVAEIDLAAIRDAIGDESLPASGFLEFFYDADQEAWGFDPAERLKWRVIWVDDRAPERAFPQDLQESSRFKSVDLEARIDRTFAEWESWHIERLGMDRDAAFRYADVLRTWKDPHGLNTGAVHRLLGHPDQIQGDMMLECQLASSGIYVGNSKGYQSDAAQRVRTGANEWRLLLQIDSDERSKMMWGDVGRIYYWVRDADLRAHSWERVWLCLQCL